MNFKEELKKAVLEQVKEGDPCGELLTTALELVKLEEETPVSDSALETRVKNLEAQISVMDHGSGKRRGPGALGRTRASHRAAGDSEAEG